MATKQLPFCTKKTFKYILLTNVLFHLFFLKGPVTNKSFGVHFVHAVYMISPITLCVTNFSVRIDHVTVNYTSVASFT